MSVETIAVVPPSVIRAWLRSQGHRVGDRGRISYELRLEYVSAQLDEQAVPA